jgi:hypothetical protein
MNGGFGIFPFFAAFNMLLALLWIGLMIYVFVLFIIFAHKGIKAFDIYIRKNGGNNNYPPQ